MSTRMRVLTAGVGMMVLAMLSMGFFMMNRQQEVHEEEVEARARVLLAAISAPCVSALAANHIEELDRLMEAFQEGLETDANIEWVTVLDKDLRVVGHTDNQRYGQIWSDEFTVLAAAHPVVLTRIIEAGRDRSMLVSMPLSTALDGLPGIRWGTVIARMGLSRADEHSAGIWAGSLRNIALFALVTALLLFFVLERLFVRPVARLSEAANAIKGGKLSARADVRRSGELGALGANFNGMAEELERLTGSLQKRVEERTERLNAANRELSTTAEQLKEANEQLEQLARTDPLTGLFNRRHMDETLEFHFALARRGKRALSFVMIDVDYFKNYNDTNGHPAGDIVLTMVGELLSSRLRKTDIPCRYGGEEFAVMLPDTDGHFALQVAEDIRRQVEEEPFPLQESQPDGVLTVSIGVAQLTHEMDEPGQLLEAADQALYEAKKGGRNQVAVWDAPEPGGSA